MHATHLSLVVVSLNYGSYPMSTYFWNFIFSWLCSPTLLRNASCRLHDQNLSIYCFESIHKDCIHPNKRLHFVHLRKIFLDS